MPSGTPWSIQDICTGLADTMRDLQETPTFELAARGQVGSPRGSKMTREVYV